MTAVEPHPHSTDASTAATQAADAPAASADSADSNAQGTEQDEEDDAWDKRIKDTGCFKENEALLICHADTGDWRKCLKELQAFKQCMKEHGRFDD
ncbi:hypothetical protein GGI07_003044 [Coemansia sp. Benny D115]|nr:hypothetical protein GGI07_003044 [Coemansia sp. Benny D115]